MKIYLASSWRNEYQAAALAVLRHHGHEVYDFKNPAPDDRGFSWTQTDPELKTDLTVARMKRSLQHPAAVRGFGNDFRAMEWADACVLLLPSGMSAHLEAGWFAGAGKFVAVYAPEIREPELMYKTFDIAGETPLFATPGELLECLARYRVDAGGWSIEDGAA